MQSIRNCPECGRVFAYTGTRNLCPRCIEKEEEQFLLVRRYIKDNPGAGITRVAEETGVDEEIVLRFLREGRLQSKGLEAAISTECARCGKKILTGRYCQECLVKITREFNRAAGLDQKKEPAPEPKRDTRHKWHTERDK